MKKKLCGIIAATLIGGLIMTSCNNENLPENNSTQTSGEVSDTLTTESVDLFRDCTVYYDCGTAVTDPTLSAMTDGDPVTYAKLKAGLKSANGSERKLTFTDWNGNTREEILDNSAVDFYIDIGFCAKLDKLSLSFGEYSGKSIKIFYSNDGYNFSYYAGEFDGYDASSKEWTAELDGVFAKSVMFVIPIEAGETITVSSAQAFGQSEHEKILLSSGASYIWQGTENGLFPDDGKKLTDGEYASGSATELIVGKSSDEADTLTKRNGSIITLDLGHVKNVSEVLLSAFITSSGTGTLPERINVRYSEDGENWLDLGQSFLRTSSSARGCDKLYLVTRNNTVKARYIKVYTYVTGMLLCDEIAVYGCESEVAEPDYGYPVRPQYFASNTNVASYRTAKLNGKDTSELTDNVYSKGVSANNGANTISVSLKNPSEIAGITVVTDGEIDGLSFVCDDTFAGKASSSYTTAAGEYVYSIVEESTAKAQKIDISFTAKAGIKIKEVLVYAGAAQLPYVRGGFFQLPTSGGVGASAQNSDYSWYLQLKGMRDMGMEYVVIQYSTHYNAKTTLINGKRITGAGYKYDPTYGSADVCKAVLDAAEKLGMKVWLGTIHDSDFTNPVTNMAEYKKIVAEAKYIIDDIYELYGNHPAFGGYYLSDETCDQWLNLSGGVDAARYVYKGQSDRIREIAPYARIMIAPAIWRSGDPVKGADNLYRMIVGEKKGQRPIVDIVAAQDCLGRESTLAVTDSAYKSYLTYVEEWAKAVRRAGAEFWHDAEVFEIINTQKRHDDLLKTLTLEAPISGSIIVFDIPHYFSIFPMGGYNNEYDYYKRLKMREYAEYYSGIKGYVDAGFDAVNEEVNENDGKTVEANEPTLITPPKSDTVYNGGILINSAPTDTDGIEWHTFAKGNTAAKAEYALFWDGDAFYVVLKTNDETADFGKGAWWESKNDLVQIWLSGDGTTQNDTSASEFGVRYYINRLGESKFTSGGEASGKAIYSGFEYTYNDGIFIIKMPWKSIGRTAPEKGDGTAIGISIQYIDGVDSSWSASTGNTGRSVSAKELYSF